MCDQALSTPHTVLTLSWPRGEIIHVSANHTIPLTHGTQTYPQIFQTLKLLWTPLRAVCLLKSGYDEPSVNNERWRWNDGLCSFPSFHQLDQQSWTLQQAKHVINENRYFSQEMKLVAMKISINPSCSFCILLNDTILRIIKQHWTLWSEY